MSETNTMRRTGRDGRNAGSYRRIRIADRERDLARSEARELKGRGLVWSSVDYAAPSRLPVTTQLGLNAKRSAGTVGHISASTVRGEPSPTRRAGAASAPIGDATPSSDRSWLPEVGAPIVIAGVRIAAFEVAGACDQPFYVLARVD